MNRRTLLFLPVLMLSVAAPVPAADDRPELWAVYYAWYETGTGPHGRWRMWSNDQTTTADPKPKSVAHPLIGYYDSDDREVVRWHIRLAKAAGIDALQVSWWGGANLSGRAFEGVVLPVAAEEDFKVALCSELAQFHHDVKVLTRQTSDVLQSTKDNPAYLRVDGKPLVIPRDDGATLRGYLRAATDAGADAILVTSFNEWPETTVVEPSSSWSDPYQYLKILAEWKGLDFTLPPLPQCRSARTVNEPEAPPLEPGGRER